MGSRESAWGWAHRKWHPHEPTDDQALEAVRDSLRRLMQMPVPVSAIEEIQTLLVKHEQYVLEDN